MPPIEFDLLVVGAGPAGLAAAIRYKQLRPEASVCVLEKGVRVGAHLVSGALFDPRPLDELLPGWREEEGVPIGGQVVEERLWWLSARRAWPWPGVPSDLRHDGALIVRLGLLCAWLAARAEAMGIEILTATAAHEPLWRADGGLAGVRTGAFGLDEHGQPGSRYQPGWAIHARHTLLAEGSRGHLGRQLIAHFDLAANRQPQNYALGLKELWRIPRSRHWPGVIWHTLGWPLWGGATGGGFCYPLDEDLLSVGLIVHLGYRHPRLSPYDEMQRWKQHPLIADLLAGGQRLGFGARAITLGGLPALPRVAFPGGGLIGDDAGFAVPARLMGIHTAMKSGMLMAEACAEGLDCPDFVSRFQASWLGQELACTQAFKGALRLGLLLGGALFVLDRALGGHGAWAPRLVADHERLDASLRHLARPAVIFDGRLTFDRATSLALAGVSHTAGQPCHLKLNAQELVQHNLMRYGGPETYYCPAGVYEYLPDHESFRLVLHAERCLHCKTCDIKDPCQRIIWRPPQGGDGPRYVGL